MKAKKAAQLLGRLGGVARAKALTPEQRKAISQKANRIKTRRQKAQKGLS